MKANLHLLHPAVWLTLILVVLAFWPSYVAVFGDWPEIITPTIHVHTVVMLLWLAMLATQASLIRARKTQLHRVIGRTSYAVVPIIVLLIIIATHDVLQRPDSTLHSINTMLALGQITAFGSAWALALVFRRRPKIHSRFMVCTAIAMTPAVFLRIYSVWVPGFASFAQILHANFLTIGLLLGALIYRDWKCGVTRSPFLTMFGIMSAFYFSCFHLVDTKAWSSFVGWYASI